MAISLKSLTRGPQLLPPRIFLFGVEGIGKSTFGASAPNPVFIQTEDGLGTIDTTSFPLCTHADQVLECIESLLSEDHEFQTVVLDSADWLDTLIQKKLETEHDAKDLAYGKGAVMGADAFKQVLDGLNALREQKNMAVILLAHTEIKRFDSPETEPYDRYQPKLQNRASALVREWADAVLFANYRTVIRSTDVGFNKKVSRGTTTGERLLYTSEKPAYLAKNRFSLPESLPLSWQALAEAIEASAAPQSANAA